MLLTIKSDDISSTFFIIEVLAHYLLLSSLKRREYIQFATKLEILGHYMLH